MSTLSQLEFDRLELALQNSKPHWQASPNKRVLQLAFEEIENLRRALPHVQKMEAHFVGMARGLNYLLLYPSSARARREAQRLYRMSTPFSARLSAETAREILGRKANVTRPDGTTEYA